MKVIQDTWRELVLTDPLDRPRKRLRVRGPALVTAARWREGEGRLHYVKYGARRAR